MAAESLLGGSRGPIDDDVRALLDQFLTDTVGGSSQTTDLGNGSTLVIGKGHNGETQGAIVTKDATIAAEVNAGVMHFAIQLPAGVNIAFESLSEKATPTQIANFLNAQIEAALPSNSTDPGIQALNAALTNAVNNLITALNANGVGESVLSIISFADISNSLSETLAETAAGTAITVDPNAGNTIKFTALDPADKEVFALLLNEIQQGKTLELSGVEHAVLVGSGTVKVGDNTNVNLQGDNRAQEITGGSGNDTLVGGGGNDSLIGGGGDDIIGFNALGHYNVQIDNGDKLAFQFDGIQTVADLLPFVTNVSEANGNVTFEFLDGDASITLVGMSANDVTADMVIFNLS